MILKALQKYGMIVADNGSAWYISGAPDDRWNNDNLHQLGKVLGSSFEAVDVSSLMIDPNSGQAKQPGGTAPVAVVVTPSSATVLTSAQQKFSANQTVTWSVNGVAGGNSQVGLIDSTGLYTAPGAVPNPATVTVLASAAGSTGTAAVTIKAPPPPPPPVTVVVTPSSATLLTSAQQKFSANQTVTWSVNGVTGGNSQVGLIDSTGLYTAPAAVPNPATVTVQAVASASAATASVAIKAPAAPPPPPVSPPPAIISITPNPSRGSNFILTITGTGFQAGAVVKLNGAALATTFLSNSRLRATGGTAKTGGLPIQVTNRDGQVSAAYIVTFVGSRRLK